MKRSARPSIETELLHSLLQRRKQLGAALPESSILILSSQQENHAFLNYNKYHSGNHFYYLTGVNEPTSHLVISKKNGTLTTHLFLRSQSETTELWNGPMWGIEGVHSELGFENIHASETFQAFLNSESCKSFENIFLNLQQDNFDINFFKDMLGGDRYLEKNFQIRDAGFYLHSMRELKDEYEIKCLTHTGKVSSEAIKHVMRLVKAGVNEKQIEAELEYFYKANGLEGSAYLPIVASGENACCLHHQKNSSNLEIGELLLIDAGGSYKGYAADISRTFPVSGKFQNPEQIALYEIVLQAQTEAFELLQEGAIWNVWHDKACEVITQGLLKLNLLQGSLEENIKNATYKQFYPHGTSHYLGLDVHDKGKRFHSTSALPLKAGMVITVEPGIYIQPHNLSVPQKWRGIGIRIEDDVLITKNGFVNLTSAPKTISEIEATMAGKL